MNQKVEDSKLSVSVGQWDVNQINIILINYNPAKSITNKFVENSSLVIFRL